MNVHSDARNRRKDGVHQQVALLKLGGTRSPLALLLKIQIII